MFKEQKVNYVFFQIAFNLGHLNLIQATLICLPLAWIDHPL